MYIFENALRNVIRNKGRNLLIGAIIFAVIVTTVVAMMIRTTASGIIDDYKGRFSSEVRISANMEKVREEAMASMDANGGRVLMTNPSLTADEYIAFGDSEYLAGSVYTAQTGLNSDSIAAVDADADTGMGGDMGFSARGGGGEVRIELPEHSFRLLGGSFDEFEDGTRALVEGGEYPEGENEVLVSEDLAEANGIAVGDTLEMTGTLYKLPEDDSSELTTEDIAYSLTVTGIYYDLNDDYAEGGMERAFYNRSNELLATYETVAENYSSGYEGMTISATYYLENPDMLAAFEEEVRAKGLSELFDISTDTASYERIVAPVEGLKSISFTFMIIVLAFGAIIIALLSSIAVRERKYEIGVLRAMGMKKGKVALGLWIETLAITAVCLVLGLGVGTLAAQPISDVLLSGQVEAAAAATNAGSGGPGNFTAGGPGGGGGPMMFGMGGSSQSNVEPLSELDVTLGLGTAAQIIGIALLLAVFASLIAASRITKYEPIKILTERN